MAATWCLWPEVDLQKSLFLKQGAAMRTRLLLLAATLTVSAARADSGRLSVYAILTYAVLGVGSAPAAARLAAASSARSRRAHHMWPPSAPRRHAGTRFTRRIRSEYRQWAADDWWAGD